MHVSNNLANAGQLALAHGATYVQSLLDQYAPKIGRKVKQPLADFKADLTRFSQKHNKDNQLFQRLAARSNPLYENLGTDNIIQSVRLGSAGYGDVATGAVLAPVAAGALKPVATYGRTLAGAARQAPQFFRFLAAKEPLQAAKMFLSRGALKGTAAILTGNSALATAARNTGNILQNIDNATPVNIPSTVLRGAWAVGQAAKKALDDTAFGRLAAPVYSFGVRPALKHVRFPDGSSDTRYSYNASDIGVAALAHPYAFGNNRWFDINKAISRYIDPAVFSHAEQLAQRINSGDRAFDIGASAAYTAGSNVDKLREALFTRAGIPQHAIKALSPAEQKAATDRLLKGLSDAVNLDKSSLFYRNLQNRLPAQSR